MLMRYAIILVGFLLCYSSASAQNITLCPDGITQCKSFEKDIVRYTECMNRICVPSAQKKTKAPRKKTSVKDVSTITPTVNVPFSEVEEKLPTLEASLSNIAPCDNGLRRCNLLRDDKLAYWMCMKDTCEARESSDAVCTQGKNACVDSYKQYQVCVNLICRNPPDFFNECEKGKRTCRGTYNNFWDCVSVQCLGDIDQFIKASKDYRVQKETEQREEKLKETENKQVALKAAPEEYQYPPDGVSALSYSMGVTPSRRVHGSHSSALKCQFKSATLFCPTEDVLGCTCSDGTAPQRKEIPQYNYETPEYVPQVSLPREFMRSAGRGNQKAQKERLEKMLTMLKGWEKKSQNEIKLRELMEKSKAAKEKAKAEREAKMAAFKESQEQEKREELRRRKLQLYRQQINGNN